MSVECESEALQTQTKPPGDRRPMMRVRAGLTVLRRSITTHFLSLRAKVVGLLTLIGAVLVALSGVYVAIMFNQNLAHEAELRAGAASDVLAYAAQRTDRPGEMEPILSAIGNAPYIKDVAIGGHNGQILAASDLTWQGKHIAAALPAVPGIGRPVAIEPQTHLPGGSPRGGDFAVWFDSPHAGERMMALVRIDMERLTTRLTTRAWNIMTWLTITAILAILTISMLIHRIVVVPIEALRDYARRNRHGETEASTQGDEIGVVARALTASFQAAREGEARLASIAATDGLTGLDNRGYFKTQLADAIARAERDCTFVRS